MLHNFKSVFVVDDDKFHLEMMTQILTDAGVTNIKCFESGIECLERIHQNPDVIFLDHQMDVYTGYITLRKIKRYNPNLFVVMVSAQEDIETAVDSLKHGAFDYVKKNENLVTNISNVLMKVAQVKELLQHKKPSLLKNIFKVL